MPMKKVALLLGIPALALTMLAADVAEALYVYPAKGQSRARMQRDKLQCSQWATRQTGFDPTRPPPVYYSRRPPRGGVLRGGAIGAAGGAMGGAIAGNAGKGAAIGAVIGGLLGGVRRRQYMREEEYARRQTEARYSAHRQQYYRAYIACLNGRGYTVR